jgi:hypothetical protein
MLSQSGDETCSGKSSTIVDDVRRRYLTPAEIAEAEAGVGQDL